MARSLDANVDDDLYVLVAADILTRSEYGVTKGRIDDLGVCLSFEFEYFIEEVRGHGAGALLLMNPLEDVLAPPIFLEVLLLAGNALDVVAQCGLNLAQLVVVVVREQFSYLGLVALEEGLGP
jgi:hypothetical protein